MDIAKSCEDGDSTMEQDGLNLFLDPLANDMLVNTTIDFTDAHGFVLKGAQQNSCGSCKC